MTRRKEYWNEKRSVALGAVRSYLRSMDIDPLTVDYLGASKALDDLLRLDPHMTTIAAQFCWNASLTQLKLFYREWEQWRKEQSEKG